MSVVTLLAVLAGFARTFYLRAFFDVPPIQGYLYVHGTILTAWFALCVVQTFLVSIDRRDLHRRSGWFGAALAVLVVITGVIATLGSIQRSVAEGDEMGSFPYLAWLNFGGLLVFVVFVGAAVGFRRRSEIHKRLMFFASMNIIGAALARITDWPMFAAGTPLSFVDVALSNYFAGELLLLSALIAHDFISTKRVHPVTAIGALLSALSVVIPAMISQTDLGRAIILAIA
jgi:hypothetical protein